jgi:dienelactone hydrolase
MKYRASVLAALVSCLSPGCSEEEPPRSALACPLDPGGSPWTTEQVLAGGPHAVGQASEVLVDASRATPASGDAPALPERTLGTRVWYPASEAGSGTPVAEGGPFPLVIYSHGLSSFNSEGTGLASMLASLGYVVFAPQFPLSHLGAAGGPTVLDIANQPGDVSFVIDSALAMSAEGGHVLEGAIDAERIAAVGLSLGGLTTLLVTFHPTLHDPRVDVAAAMAPPASFLGEAFYDTRVAPLLLLSGDIDAIVPHPMNAVLAFDRVDPPVSFFTLVAGTHTGFTSIASLFETADNADVIGCDTISGAVGTSSDGGTSFDIVEALGGASAGLVPAMVGPVCVEPLPYGMRPSRQQDITLAAISTFLEAYLSSDPQVRGRACHYNERVLGAESDDLRFVRR